MPRSMTISTLPLEVRDELNNELVKSNFSHYDKIVAWLESKGYPIARSSLHRYATKHRFEILGLHAGSRFEYATLKLQALRIATERTPEAELASLQEYAEAILQWALEK
ncbi:hypothetical protein DJ539_02035 [Enterobacter hormaechei]|jgi:hypothetical protein|uniref:phage protein Gp27 family protein n=1 Tax=Enterobacteriaceae TaxID=543 RepID=UPI0011E48678|nr:MULTISPECIES: phage protein Gp27 family protein [Enterobacteriaceae]ECC8921014.1 hypothetical protein [Salmonella bongori]QLR26712.1 DUF3486 family protein [Citrobacter sp. RHBSTW-01013]TYF78130.1 hypothetical protein DJ539_02035 [Enterobacter hormaechei]